MRFSRGDDGRADSALDLVAQLVADGRFVLPVERTFPLADVAEAHRVGESGEGRGKPVLITRESPACVTLFRHS